MPGFELTEEELRVFLQEASEQLEIMEQGLLRFEKDAGNPALVQEIFRAAHTLKGGAGAAGFQDMERLTHVLESILDQVRDGSRVVTVALIDRMLEAVDVLRHALIAIESDEPRDSVDLGEVCARLERLLEEAEDGQLVEWTVRVREEAQMPSIRLYQAQLILEEAGALRSVHPTAEMLEAEEHRTMTAQVVHAKPPEEVEAALKAIDDVEHVEWSVVGEEAPTVAPADGQAAEEAVDAEKEAEAPATLAPQGSLAQTVRVDVALLDRLMNLVGELVTDRTRLNRLVSLDAEAEALQEELEEVSSHLSRITTDLQESIMRARMIPLSTLFRKFPRMIRDASHQLGKEVDFVVAGEETELDRSVIEQIGDPLMHLLRNAVDHGLEGPEDRLRAGKPATGRVSLTAYHQENHIFIEVADDGRGIDPQSVLETALERGFTTQEAAQNLSESEILELIMTPGFSTAKEVSSLSGRGVGLDVVRRNIERVNGQLTIDSRVGEGTTWRIKLPLTLAIVQALLVELGGEVFAIPISNVIEALRKWSGEVEAAHGWQMIRVRDEVMPLIDPADVWGEEYRIVWPEGRPVPVVVLQAGLAPMALTVDRLLGEQEVVIKQLDPIVGDVPGVSGASILGDGSVALIVDVVGLAKEVRRRVTL